MNYRFKVSGSKLQAYKWQNYIQKADLFYSKRLWFVVYAKLIYSFTFTDLSKSLVCGAMNACKKVPNENNHLLITSFKVEIYIQLYYFMVNYAFTLKNFYYP